MLGLGSRDEVAGCSWVLASDLTREFSPGLLAAVCLEDLAATLGAVLSVSCVGHPAGLFPPRPNTGSHVMKTLSACLGKGKGRSTDRFASGIFRGRQTRFHTCAPCVGQALTLRSVLCDMELEWLF